MVQPVDPCFGGVPMGEVIIESSPLMPLATPQVMPQAGNDSAPPVPESTEPSDLPEAAETDAPAEESVPAEEPAPAAEPTPAAEPNAEATSPSDVAEPAEAEPSPFDEPATEAPAEEAPAAEPSPFDEPAAEEPTPAPAEEPAADPFDFGTPDETPAEEPAADAGDAFDFGTPEPAADTPADPAPSTTDDAFDIFGDSPAESEAPAEPAADSVLDDILNDVPAADPPAAAPAEGSDPFEDLLNPTSTREKDKELEKKRQSIFDELFGAIQQVPAWYAAAAEEAQCQLIAQQHQASAMVSVASTTTAPTIDQTEMRTWQDDSGTFSTEGRLILITETFVRLLKPNGRTCTVPVERLSAEDAAYVSQVSKATQAKQALVALVN